MSQIDIKRLEEIALNSSAADTHEEEQIAHELLAIRAEAAGVRPSAGEFWYVLHYAGGDNEKVALIEQRDLVAAQQRRALVEALRAVLDVKAIKNERGYLSRGIGTSTPDGQAILAALAAAGEEQ